MRNRTDGELVSPSPRSRNAFGLYAVLVMVWGLVWPASKLALVHCPPVLFAGLRVFVSGVALLPWAIAKWDRETLWVNGLLVFLNVFFFFGLQNLALIHLGAGLLSLLVYIQPVATAVLSRVWLQEAFNPAKVIGIGLGFLGVAWISVGPLAHQRVGGLAVLWGLLAGISWAAGTVFYKRYRTRPRPLTDMGIQLFVGGLLLLMAGSLQEHWSHIQWGGPFLAELLFAALPGTALAWVIWAHLLQTAQASRVASWTFLVPLISTVLSIGWLHERLSLGVALGGALVLLGVYLVNGPTFSGGGTHAQNTD